MVSGYWGSVRDDACQTKCRAESVVDSKTSAVFSWPATVAGKTVRRPCPQNQSAFAERECILSSSNFPSWGPVKDSACQIKCQEESSGGNNTSSLFYWPAIIAGETAKLPCPQNKSVYAKRECIHNSSYSASWGPVIDNDCQLKCQAESTNSTMLSTVFYWPVTIAGRTVRLSCPQNQSAFAERECILSSSNSPTWGPVKESACQIKCQEESAGGNNASSLFYWPAIIAGETAKLPCPQNQSAFAERKCIRNSSYSASWGIVKDKSCQIKCQFESFGGSKTSSVFNWPATVVGKTAKLPCPQNKSAYAKRECIHNSSYSASWGPVIDNDCQLKCQAESTNSTMLSTVFYWPVTIAGRTIRRPCPQNQSAFAERECILSSSNSPTWGPVKDSTCQIKCQEESAGGNNTSSLFYWPAIIAGETAKLPCPQNQSAFAERKCIRISLYSASWGIVKDKSCQIKCQFESFGGSKTSSVFNWPATVVGKTAKLPCPQNKSAYAKRECIHNSSYSASWGPVIDNDCQLKCQAESTNSTMLSTVFNWPVTIAGRTVRLSCPNTNDNVFAERKCVPENSSFPSWGPVKDNTCEIECPAENAEGKKTSTFFKWPATTTGTTAEALCSEGQNEFATRTCTRKGSAPPSWGPVRDSNCKIPQSKRANEIKQLANVSILILLHVTCQLLQGWDLTLFELGWWVNSTHYLFFPVYVATNFTQWLKYFSPSVCTIRAA